MSAKERPEPGVRTPVAKPVPPPGPVLTRRVFILGGFWSSMLLAAVGVLGAPLDFVWPRRRAADFGGELIVPADQVPPPGSEPVRFPTGRFYLSHLSPGQEGSPGGVLAIYQKCTHLGCTVPWRPDFQFQDETGWFRCPCHGSTYTKGAAILVFGPAPRPLDLLDVQVKENGDLVVNTGAITKGSPENPLRAVPYGAAASPGAAPPAAGPRFAADGDTFDLGVVPVGETVERSIEFRNAGDAPLAVSILKVRPAPDAACGCGVEGFRVEPASVPAGGNGRLLFDLKAPEGMESMTDKMVAELESNDPAKPTLTITLIFMMGP